MRTSQYLLSTIKEIPTDAEVTSHQLMLRAGIIRKLASGFYTWLPTGLRVLHKVEKIIREEMNKIGAIEISMPMINPINLWQKTGRLTQYGCELLQITDRNKRKFVLSPTHEEVIIDLVRNEINSYKQLPLIFYQIKTKFRDEIRPRFGVIRSREFIMKDAYSFHTNQKSLQNTYDIIYKIYKVIFNRMKLNYCVVQANNGIIGGNISHEFHVLADIGEDDIVLSSTSNYAANIKLAKALISSNAPSKPCEKIRLVETIDELTINELIKKFNLPIEKTIKILVVHANKNMNYPLIALIIRGDHQLNLTKVEKLSQVSVPIVFASEEEIILAVGVGSKSLGPLNLSLPLIIDKDVALMSDFIAGANIRGKYFFGVNWQRDLPLPEVRDIRNVINGDISPDGNGRLEIKHGIEIGHIFQLGSKYSTSINAQVQCENGHKMLIMGCYGIGITRLIAAIVEQHNDKRGILWPDELAPFNIAILPINFHRSPYVKYIAEKLYKQLYSFNVDVLFDDRKEHPGVIFSDIELIGIPHIIIVSERSLKIEKVEYKHRKSGKIKLINLSEIVDYLIKDIMIAK